MMQTRGISLAEIIITLVVLAVISALAIPKVMESHKVHQNKKAVQAAVMAISNAYSRYKLDQDPTADFNPTDLVPYLNYVRLQTTGALDNKGGNLGKFDCEALAPCMVMHNGSSIWLYQGNGTTWGTKFGGTAANYYTDFYMDPDGDLQHETTTTGLGKSFAIGLYYDGRVKTGCEEGDEIWWDGSLRDWCPDANEVGTWWDDAGYDPDV